ncbi:MAG TPA: transcriptional regulator [Jeotgalicoccus sp.]|uniref:helix-turn-helix transcriptional regulator n=1 Tax=Phocicoccus schoeneichii TaxID=1812261 RepID=UPI002BB779DF|nr:transcriptional regulator [Jeotgalicoccus sp.]
MDREAFTKVIQSKFKIIRTEAGYTQDSMSQTVGLSKKTLVQIEKERIIPNWTTCVSICALFRDSDTLTSTFGGDPLELAQVLSRGNAFYPDYLKESLYWETVEEKEGWTLQRNKMNDLHRVLNPENRPVHASYLERQSITYFKQKTKD